MRLIPLHRHEDDAKVDVVGIGVFGQIFIIAIFFSGEDFMLRTISVGSYISIQGVYVRSLPDGRIVIRDGGKTFCGFPISQAA